MCVAELTFENEKLTDDDLKCLDGFDALASLGFQNCPRVTGAGFGVLAKLPRLKVLSCVGPVTDAACPHIGRIKSLEEVTFAATKVTDAGLKELAALPVLRAVNLTATPAAGSAFARPAGVNCATSARRTRRSTTRAWKPSPSYLRWRC